MKDNKKLIGFLPSALLLFATVIIFGVLFWNNELLIENNRELRNQNQLLLKITVQMANNQAEANSPADPDEDSDEEDPSSDSLDDSCCPAFRANFIPASLNDDFKFNPQRRKRR